jgi:hypothetical protein
MKVIFLDIDGVLASMDYLKVTSFLKIPHPDEFGYGFDPRCVLNLEKIILQTDAVIVISSYWKSMGINRLNYMWKVRNLPGKIIGITQEDPSGKRGLEIEKWLNENKNINSYVILDDDHDMLSEQVNNFIKINAEFGISFKNTETAINILGKK